MSLKLTIENIRNKIIAAEINSGRKLGSVTLMAVSKQQPVSSILEAFSEGISCFGESYLQEAQAKIIALKEYPIQWHFIGPVQSKKSARISELFDWVHSVDRIKIAKALNNNCISRSKILNICIQVKLMDEPNKSGIIEDQIPELIWELKKLKNLRLRGLMCIPAPSQIYEEQLFQFHKLSKILETLNHNFNLTMDTLSMGMSHDYESAIKAGATIIRIGQGIFGQRQNYKGLI